MSKEFVYPAKQASSIFCVYDPFMSWNSRSLHGVVSSGNNPRAFLKSFRIIRSTKVTAHCHNVPHVAAVSDDKSRWQYDTAWLTWAIKGAAESFATKCDVYCDWGIPFLQMHRCNNREFHETCHSVTFYFMKKKKDSKRCCWHHNARVNSHQRWKQTRFRVCFHLWCELTATMNVTEWQVSWNSR